MTGFWNQTGVLDRTLDFCRAAGLSPVMEIWNMTDPLEFDGGKKKKNKRRKRDDDGSMLRKMRGSRQIRRDSR